MLANNNINIGLELLAPVENDDISPNKRNIIMGA